MHVGAELRRRDRLVVRIRDNGRGMACVGQCRRTASGMGVGIPGGAPRRLRQFGGDLKIRSGSHGTSLLAYVPLARGAWVPHDEGGAAV